MGGETRVCICTDCGGQFLFRSCEQARYRELGWVDPKRCPDCRAAVKERRRKAATRVWSWAKSFCPGERKKGETGRWPISGVC